MKIEGKRVQVDMSGGQGHRWVDVTEQPVEHSDDLQEVAAEIIDGKISECRDYVTRGGARYRWS